MMLTAYAARAALRGEYRQGAVNEGRVARLQARMRELAHRHEYPRPVAGLPVTCIWCGKGKAS